MQVLAHIVVNQSREQLIKIGFNHVGVVTALVDPFTTYNPGVDNRST